MLRRFPQLIGNSNYSLLPPIPPPYPATSSAAFATAIPNFPTTKMYRPSSSFAQSPRSGGRERGQSEMGGSRQGSRGGGCGAVAGGASKGDNRGAVSGGTLRGDGSRAVAGGTSRGSGRGAVAGGMSNRIDALGRILVRILRHMAQELNLDMRSDGYVKVKDLLKLDLKSRANIPLRSHSIDEIREAVRTDNKQRLGLSEENGELFLRANQGHSVKVVETELLLKPITKLEDIPVCVHGTYKKFLDSILQSGLKRMNRLHIHFSSGLPTDQQVISGMRRDINMVIFLDVKKALEDGMKLYMSENKVILTEGFNGVVPAKYFQKIQLWPSREPVAFENEDIALSTLSNLKS